MFTKLIERGHPEVGELDAFAAELGEPSVLLG